MLAVKRTLSAKWLAILSALALAIVIGFIYSSALSTGFFADDFNFLEPAARLNLGDYLIHYFDPRVQVLWYRPLQGIQILFEWWLFGANATGYHAVNIFFHIVNCALLFALVWRVSAKWHLAFAAAFFYATFPAYALAVNWINITDPLATIFYLLGIWFWWSYLENGKTRYALITLALYALGVLTKQMAITLPVVLFLMERFIFKPAPLKLSGNGVAAIVDWLNIPQALQRYWVFAIIAGAFAAIQFDTRSTHTFAGTFGYTLGLQLFSILVQYLSLTVFPWGYFLPTDTQVTDAMPFSDERNLIWLAVALLIYLVFTLRTRNRVLVFLGLAWLITIAPVLPFPFIELRYLYLPLMASGIVLALLLDHALVALKRARWISIAASIGLVLITVGVYYSIANANAGISEIARQRRVPFHDISSAHPRFADDTHLYFIDTISPLSELSGLFVLRYGRGVTVNGNDAPEPVAHLRDYPSAFVYYFDETGKPIEIAVEPRIAAQPSIAPPLDYAVPIRLEGYELPRATLKRGDPFAILLYWRATGKIDQDYAVFAHLLDQNRQFVDGYDGPPRRGNLPTTAWTPGALVADGVIFQIPADAPLGDGYSLEVGLYEYPSLERIPFVDSRGQPMESALVIAPLSVVEK